MRRLLLCLVAVLVLIAPCAASAAEPGLNVQGIDNGGDPEAMNMLQDTGAKWARHFLQWDRFEPAKGQFDEALISHYKQTMDKEQTLGVKTMLTVVRSPSWASGSLEPYTPPQNPADFAAFMGHISKEFAGRVEVIEIWNEQDEAIFWKGVVNAAQYTDMLKAAYPAIKQSDPNIKVAFGPTTGNNYKYLEQAYAAGAQGSFDAVSVHTDTACSIAAPSSYYRDAGRIAQFTFLGYREIRNTMINNGDQGKPVYMSELGWSTTTRTCDRGMWAGQKPAGVSEAQQAAFLSEAYHCLEEDPYVEIGIWFEAKDRSVDDTELTRYGLRRPDSTNKPAYDAFKSYARNGNKLTGVCGDFEAPKVTVKSPQPNLQVYDKLVLHATSSDKDVVKITFSVDGKLVENYTPNVDAGEQTRDYVKKPAYRDWQGVRKLSFGPHTLSVLIKDASGNEREMKVPFTRIDPSTLGPVSTRFTQLKLAGKGRKRTIQGQLISPGYSFAIPGKVQVIWQAKRKGGWKKIHGGQANANAPFKFQQKLKFKGKWRVRVQYAGKKPYKKSASAWKTFTVR